MTNQKALIAMSGGVDSSVAAHLTLREGHTCMGAMLRLFDNSIRMGYNTPIPSKGVSVCPILFCMPSGVCCMLSVPALVSSKRRGRACSLL